MHLSRSDNPSIALAHPIPSTHPLYQHLLPQKPRSQFLPPKLHFPPTSRTTRKDIWTCRCRARDASHNDETSIKLPLHPLVHRRCRAGGNLQECILYDCKRFLAVGGQGLYFGSFNSIGGLLFSCRDIFQQVSNVLYTQNTFEFDHPHTLTLFQMRVHPSSFNSIKSISINMQRGLYRRVMTFQASTSMHHDLWHDKWNIIARMENLEQVRVGFRFPLDGWLGWSDKNIPGPLWKVTRPMRVFEVECQAGIAYRDGEYSAAPFKLVGNHA